MTDGGYLLDPMREAVWSGGTQLRTLPQLGGLRGLALLGEPGMGKSVALEAETRRQREDVGSDTTIIHADLRAYSSDVLLNAKVFECAEVRAWKEGAGELVLHLDSLDEALLRIETVAAFLAEELPRLPAERLSVRITCRTLDWHAVAPTLMPVFQSLWDDDAVGAYEIAPLRRADVRAAANEWRVDADAFLDQVRVANAIPFAIKPLTLILLLRLFEADGRLPDSVGELYRRGCLNLCEEQSRSRRAPRREGHLAPVERLRIAGRVAAVTMLANRYALWTGLESADVPAEDVPLSALAIGSEPCDARSISVMRDELREVLDTGLFSSRGGDRMGWAHQSYAEFLGADYLIARQVPTWNILDVLRHPSGGLIPQLAMVAAWAASLNRDVRRELIEHEPVALLHGDLAGWDAADLGALTSALLRVFDQDRATDFALGLDDRYRKLAHPGLAAILRPYLGDSNRSVVARRAAIRIAEACSLQELQDPLLALALDTAVDEHIRACCVSALKTCGDENARFALRPLALDAAGTDPFGEIKGNALALLWPNHLNSVDLFRNITPPRESYFGAYANFLTYTLPESLKREDLPAALEWAATFVRGADHMGDFQQKRLADAILLAAWDHIRDPDITPLVFAYVQVAVQQLHELFVGIDREASDEFRMHVGEDTEGRRAFLRVAMSACPRMNFVSSLVQSGLLRREDLFWLLSLLPCGESGANELDEEALCEFVQASLDLSDEAHFAALYDAAGCWPLLRSKFSPWFDGVAIDSPMAEQMKEYHRLLAGRPRRERPKIDPPPAQRVRECLDRIEAGELSAWTQLNAELTLRPDSVRYGWDLEYRIARMPGWTDADDGTRDRILSSALRFIESGESTADRWIGGAGWNSREIAGDLAAYRAIVLLCELRPDTYCNLATTVWRKWAQAVVALPRETGTEDSKLHDHITADAIAAAPEEIAAAVLTLVRCERNRQATAEQPHPEDAASFLFLRQFNPERENVPLATGLLVELMDGHNTPQQFAALLDFLLRAKSEDAKKYALRLFESWPCSAERRSLAISTATTLLETDGVSEWPRIWRAITADAEFGRELFLRVSQRHRMDASLSATLPEAELGALYVWLEREFPHSSDPSHDGAHWMSPRDSVIQLRDGSLNALVHRGTPEAVAAMREVMANLPELRWLAFQLLEAEQLMRQRTWTPLTPPEVLRLAETTNGRLVQSGEQLSEILVAALRKYEAGLHGEQTPVRALWDRQASGKELRPVEEDALSDHVKLFLQQELVERGIVLNREVEIGRVPGAPVGSRTDIRVNAVRKLSGEALDAITAVIETKGCWNPDLITAIKTQLHDDYLARLGAPVGIYLVGWFDKARWDSKDRRRAKAPDWNVAEAQRRLDAEAVRLTGRFLVRAVVLDCHAPGLQS